MQIGRAQAKRLKVKPRVQQSPMIELCALRMGGKTFFVKGAEDVTVLSWTETLTCLTLTFCLGDGHAGIWSLFSKMTKLPERRDTLGWYHLKENLHKVSGSNNRLKGTSINSKFEDIEVEIPRVSVAVFFRSGNFSRCPQECRNMPLEGRC
jgi:hypothetical protein